MVLGVPGAAGPVVGVRAAADRVVLELHDPDALGVAGRTVLVVFDEHVAEIVAGIVLGVAEAAFHQTVIRAVDHVLGILLGQLVVAFGAAQQVHFAQQVACGPRCELTLLHVVGIVGKVRLGKFQVFDDVSQHFDLGIAREREQERLLDGLDPGHVAVEVDQRAVGVSPEETGFGLVKLFVGGIVPVVVLFGIDQQFVGRADQVEGPVPVRADEKRRRVERHLGERNQRTVADGSHAAEVGRNLEHFVGAGTVVHESAVFTPGVVFRAGDGVESCGTHLEAQRTGVSVVGSQRTFQLLFQKGGTARSYREDRTCNADLDIIHRFHGQVLIRRLRLIPARRNGRSGTMRTRCCRSSASDACWRRRRRCSR